MKNKNLIIICAGLAAVVILAVMYFAFLSGKQNDENVGDDRQSDETQETVERKKLFSVTGNVNKISSVEFFSGGEEKYRIYKDASTGYFYVEGLAGYMYSTVLDNVLSAAAGLTATGTVDEPGEDVWYGLSGENSPYMIRMYTEGAEQPETLYIGDKLVTGDGYYCRKDGDDALYTVGTAANTLMIDKNSFVSPLLAKELDSARYHYTEEFVLRKELVEFVHIEYVPDEEQDEENAYDYYRMKYPGNYTYTPSDVNYDALLKLLMTPTADTVVTTDLSDENLIKYGFMNESGQPFPSYEVSYTLDGETRNLYFGKRTEDGLIYVMSDTSGFIGLAGVESHFPFLDWEIIDFINPPLFGMDIGQLARLSVAGEGFSDTYVLSGKGSELVVIDEETGNVTDTQNFRNFYRVLLMTSMEGYAPEPNTDKWLLSFTIETKGGRVTEYQFYALSALKCYYTVNGVGEFYVSIDDVNKILSDAKKLAEGTLIDADARV